MPFDMTLDLTRTVLLSGVALGQTMFVLLYATFPWRKNYLGRALFTKALALAALTDAFIAYRVLNLSYSDEVFIILYGLLFVGVWAQFFAFLKVRAEGRQNSEVSDD